MTDYEKIPEEESAGPENPADLTDERAQANTMEPTLDPQTELAGAKAEVLRQRAELENFRKRMYRQMEEERRYAALPLLTDLLQVADNLSRAIESAENTPEGSSTGLLDGVRMVAAQLENTLAQHNCKRIEALGQPFDPHLHEAIGQQESELPPNTVTLVASQGYQLHDRVVRPAKVMVSKPS